MTFLQGLASVVFVLFVLGTLKHINFSELKSNKRTQHLVFGLAASMFGLWLMRVGIYDGLYVRFLLLAALTLTLGYRFSIVTATLALLGATAVGLEPWHMFGINGVLGILLPISASYIAFMLAFHKLPRHLFIYIFVCAFFPAAMTVLLTMLGFSSYFLIEGSYSWQVIFDNYLLLIPLLLFPEAILNGMLITLLVIYKPDWVYTFQDKFYIDDQ